jgi:hypothetical protein
MNNYPGGLEPNRGTELSEDDYNSNKNQRQRAKDEKKRLAQEMIAKINADIAARNQRKIQQEAERRQQGLSADEIEAAKQRALFQLLHGGRKKKVRTTKKRNMKRGHMRKRKTIKKKRHAKK